MDTVSQAMTDTSMQGRVVPWRVLLCHKHPVSARLQFLVPVQAGVCLPWQLPRLRVFDESGSNNTLKIHPTVMVKALEDILSLGREIYVVPGFCECIEVPGGIVSVYLACVTGNALPQAPTQLRWLELPDSISMPWFERELLRRAYDFLIA